MSQRVIVGDCRAVLPTLQGATVVITDPVWPNCPPGLLQGHDRPAALLAEAMEALPSSVKRVVLVLRSDCDPRFLAGVPARFPFFNALWLRYAMPGYIGRKLGGSEIAYAFGEPIRSAPAQRLVPTFSPVAQPRDRLANGHPCSRALVHFDWLVRWWTEADDVIVDPFCGSGTTLVAALRQNRAAIGIEIEPAYAEIARARLANEAPLLAVGA
jgi:site-specific DNA-methyltransferase (adenine-specific)